MDILGVLTEAYNDYAVDKRGDVGSWVRQEVMDQLLRYIDIIVSAGPVEEHLGGMPAKELFERYIALNLQ